jgi:hypothetical protein
VSRRHLIIICLAALVLCGGVALLIWFLVGEGLDRADKYVSVIGGLSGSLLGVAGLAVSLWPKPVDNPAPAPPIERYLRHVRTAICPNRLRDRESELRELAEFARGDDSPGYAYWRAPAWARKSAVMAWFVLHLPPRVRVVCYFITSRDAGQGR